MALCYYKVRVTFEDRCIVITLGAHGPNHARWRAMHLFKGAVSLANLETVGCG